MRLSAFIAVALIMAVPAPALAGGRVHSVMVYKVDRATAQITGHKLLISATGAVRTGGWQNPLLRIKPQRTAEAGILEVEFLATPPAKDAAVIQALLPVSATITVGLPRYATTNVKISAESNDITVPIENAR